VAAPALSLVTDRSEHFRLTWRGYDRAEVDAFLSRTAADRHRLQTDLAQLEAALADQDVARRRELERLGALRSELAQCLETSINALHIANLLLASPVRPDGCAESGTADTARAQRTAQPISNRHRMPEPWPLPSWLSPARTLALVGVVSASAVLFPVLANGDQVRPDLHRPAATAAPLALPAAPDALGPAPQPVGLTDALVLTLTALNECWIRSTIDGGAPRERLLKPNDVITLRATREAVLRVGDPAALVLQINGRPARTLGAAGRVVTARITPTNYRELLSVR
jgi:DivIVA domain-containing protein